MKRQTISFDELLKTVPREDFITYYFFHTKYDTMMHFNIGSTVWIKYIKYYDIHKPQELINSERELTNLKLYGVENQFQRKSYLKDKQIEKYGTIENLYDTIVKTTKERANLLGYNSLSQTPEAKEKRKKTCQEKYGCDYVTQSKIVTDKTANTKLERYNDAHYHNIEKMKATNLERYGVEYNWASTDNNLNGRKTQLERWGHDNFNNREKAKQTCLERYGEDYYIKQAMIMLHSLESSGNSKINKQVASYLSSVGILYTPEFPLGNFVYDFKLGKYLLEIDPSETHSSTFAPANWLPKTEDYHRNKTLNALNYGYTCIHVFDWINLDLILNGILNKTLRIVDTGKIVKHIYDKKLKQLTNKESENTIIVCDDGFELIC